MSAKNLLLIPFFFFTLVITSLGVVVGFIWSALADGFYMGWKGEQQTVDYLEGLLRKE